MKKRLFHSLALSLFILYTPPVSATSEMTVAVIAPKAGENHKAGLELIKGAKLAAKEINSNGGLLKHKIDLLTIDDRCDDRLAISTAEMLSLLNSKKIVLVIGPYCSNRYDETTTIYQQAKIFQIVPTTMALHTNDVEHRDRFTLLNTKSQLIADFFKFYNNNFAGLKVGFIYDNRAELAYEETGQELQAAFRRYGKGELLKFYPYHQQQDFSTLAKELKQDNINIILALGRSTEITPLIYDAKKKNKNLIIFTHKKNFTSELLNLLNNFSDNLYALELTDIKDSLLFTESLVNLRLLGSEPEGLEAYSYAAIKLWSELVKQSKTFNYPTLIQKVKSPAQQNKWKDLLLYSGKTDTAKYSIELYKDGDFKQVY